MRQLKNHLAAAGIVALVAAPAFADQVFYKTGTTQEICQLTGLPDAADKDGKKFGVVGTDLGYSFLHKGQVYFLFGDTNGRQGTAVDEAVEDTKNPVVNLDSIASFNGTDPNRLCTDLAFVLDPNRPDTYLPPQVALSPVYIDHIGHGTFRIPAAGFSWNDTMYVFFSRSVRRGPVNRPASSQVNPCQVSGRWKDVPVCIRNLHGQIHQLLGGRREQFGYRRVAVRQSRQQRQGPVALRKRPISTECALPCLRPARSRCPQASASVELLQRPERRQSDVGDGQRGGRGVPVQRSRELWAVRRECELHWGNVGRVEPVPAQVADVI